MKSPWAAILDPAITDSAERGYYFVYLFREDSRELSSFNQGVTDVRDIYGASVKVALRTCAIDFRSRLPNIPDQFSASQIDLRPSAQSSYAADYETGNILAKFYDPSDMPADTILAQDLQSCSSPENGARCLYTSGRDYAGAFVVDDNYAFRGDGAFGHFECRRDGALGE